MTEGPRETNWAEVLYETSRDGTPIITDEQPKFDMVKAYWDEFNAGEGFGTIDARLEVAAMRVNQKMKGESIIGA